MPDPTTRRATISEILLAVRERLAASIPLAAERVILTTLDPDDVPHHTGDRDVLVRVEDESPRPAIDGGGRYVNLRERSLAIYPRVRLRLDTRESDLALLTESTLGHLALEDAIVDALEEWIPTDSESNALATPLVLGHFSRPEKDRKDPGWARSRAQATFQYLRSLTLPERA